jgi:hypothetical protein
MPRPPDAGSRLPRGAANDRPSGSDPNRTLTLARAMRCALMPLLEFSMRALLIGIDSILEVYCWILVAVSTLHLLSGFSLVDTNKRFWPSSIPISKKPQRPRYGSFENYCRILTPSIFRPWFCY